MINTTNPSLDVDATPLDELIRMMDKGKNYRRAYSTTVYGEEVTLVFKPVPNEVYYPEIGKMMEASGMDEKAAQDLANESMDEVDSAAEIEIGGLPPEFVGFMKALCRHGIDYEAMDGDAEQLEQVFGENVETFGGFVIEWGSEISEVTDSIEGAESFR